MSTKNLTRAEIEIIRTTAPYVLFVPYWISQSLSSKGIPVEQIVDTKPGTAISDGLTAGDYATLAVFNGTRWSSPDAKSDLIKFNEFFGNINKFTTLSNYSETIATPFTDNSDICMVDGYSQATKVSMSPKVTQGQNSVAYQSVSQFENIKSLLNAANAPTNLKSYEFLTGIDGRAVICIMGPTFYKATLVSAEHIAFSVACLGELYKKLTNKEFIAHYGLFKNLI